MSVSRHHYVGEDMSAHQHQAVGHWPRDGHPLARGDTAAAGILDVDDDEGLPDQVIGRRGVGFSRATAAATIRSTRRASSLALERSLEDVGKLLSEPENRQRQPPAEL